MVHRTTETDVLVNAYVLRSIRVVETTPASTTSGLVSGHNSISFLPVSGKGWAIVSDGKIISNAGIEHLRWSLASGVGPILFGRLIERFGSAQAAMGASATMLEQIEGIGRSTAEQIARERDEVDVAAEVALAEKHGVRILSRDDEEFPPALRHIPDPPICLYVMGRIERVDAIALAVVGARRCTHYGVEQAFRFGYQLAQRGVTIISGLARGVDSQSHRGALKAGGRTLAVLGNGLSRIYPPEHDELARDITRCGAIISELPMLTSPDKSNFLPRNRLIAGLSLGVLVIEAARRSGSLTTARLGTEYDREIFALPGAWIRSSRRAPTRSSVTRTPSW